MRRLLCLLVALLHFHSDKCFDSVKYYCCITFQDGTAYEEYFYPMYLELVIRDFVIDSNIESVFFTRDLCVTDPL